MFYLSSLSHPTIAKSNNAEALNKSEQFYNLSSLQKPLGEESSSLYAAREQKQSTFISERLLNVARRAPIKS